MDLQHGLPALFHPSIKIIQGKIESCTDCDVIIITAGTKLNPGQNRYDSLNTNVEIFKSFVPQLKQYSPNAVLIVVSNPVDVMTYITWKLSGFPPNQVLGSGTLLDTYRFKHILGDKIKVNPRDITAFIIGEHGDASVPIVSKIASDLLETLNIEKIDYKSIHKEVIQSAYDITQRKGSTNYAIALAITNITKAIFEHENSVMPVSTYVKDSFGVQGEFFISLPSIINSIGVREIAPLSYTAEEMKMIKASAEGLKQYINKLKLPKVDVMSR